MLSCGSSKNFQLFFQENPPPGRKTEDREQKTENRRQKTEDREQKAENRKQRTEV